MKASEYHYRAKLEYFRLLLPTWNRTNPKVTKSEISLFLLRSRALRVVVASQDRGRTIGNLLPTANLFYTMAAEGLGGHDDGYDYADDYEGEEGYEEGWLPGGWVAQGSETSGEVWYLNAVSGETQAEVPTEPAVELPEGWYVQVSRSTQAPYYVNEHTQESQYELPDWPAPLQPAEGRGADEGSGQGSEVPPELPAEQARISATAGEVDAGVVGAVDGDDGLALGQPPPAAPPRPQTRAYKKAAKKQVKAAEKEAKRQAKQRKKQQKRERAQTPRRGGRRGGLCAGPTCASAEPQPSASAASAAARASGGGEGGGIGGYSDASVEEAGAAVAGLGAAAEETTTTSSSLPAGWEVAFSRSTGEQYYVNMLTSESQFEVPTAPATDHGVGGSGVGDGDGDPSQEAGIGEQPGDGGTETQLLQPGGPERGDQEGEADDDEGAAEAVAGRWERQITSDGEVYYACIETGESEWEVPAGGVLLESPPQPELEPEPEAPQRQRGGRGRGGGDIGGVDEVNAALAMRLSLRAGSGLRAQVLLQRARARQRQWYQQRLHEQQRLVAQTAAVAEEASRAAAAAAATAAAAAAAEEEAAVAAEKAAVMAEAEETYREDEATFTEGSDETAAEEEEEEEEKREEEEDEETFREEGESQIAAAGPISQSTDAAAERHSAMRLMTVTVPEGVHGGDMLLIQDGEGEALEVEVEVPDGLRAGDEFDVMMPSTTGNNKAPGVENDEAEDADIARQQQQQQQQQQAPEVVKQAGEVELPPSESDQRAQLSEHVQQMQSAMDAGDLEAAERWLAQAEAAAAAEVAQAQAPPQQVENEEEEEEEFCRIAMDGSLLPAGWASAQSRSTGETYYYNDVTGDSTFDLPTQPTAEHRPDT
jgi:hypothetical protein